MHRRLAWVTSHPETRARHLALGASSPDEANLRTLDIAAELAATRGAPTAAELLELGISRGSDDPSRRLQAAEMHLISGAFDRADELLDGTIAPARNTAHRLAAR